MDAKMSPSKGTSVRIFLVDGTPDGLWFIEESNWTGQAIVCSRSQYPSERDRPEFSRPCVYVLFGAMESNPERLQIYIGQADIASARLDQHTKSADKDFWTKLVIFTSTNSHMNQAHFRYLEWRLIAIARSTKRATVENKNNSGPSNISEADKADLDTFLFHMLTIYPLIGISAFQTIARPSESEQAILLRLLKLKGEVKASGYETQGGFLVNAGAVGRATHVQSLPENVVALRNELKNDGVLQVSGESLLLTRDYLFDNPNIAAQVFIGGSESGRRVWKDENGRNMNEIAKSRIIKAEIAFGTASEP